MKKKLSFLVSLLFVVMFTVACGTQDNGGNIQQTTSERSNMPVVDPIVIRFGHVGVDDPEVQTQYGALAFARRVNELSGGIMRVDVYPASQLGSSVEMGHMLQAGTLHMADLENASLTNFVPEAMWSDLPYIIQSYEHARAVYDARSSVSRWMRPLFVEQGLRVLNVYDTGFRHMMNNVNPINHPRDMDGLVMRVMPSVVMMETIAAFGSEVDTTPFAQVPDAIRGGLINGNEQTLGVIAGNRMWEFQPYISMTAHFFGLRKYTFSEVLWQQLTPAQQLIILEASEYATNRMNAHHHANEAILLQQLTQEGMQVTNLTVANMAAFIEAGATVWPLFFESIGSGNAARGSVIIDMVSSYIP
ncbi:MAG: TRAP transporter substrate-binding protein [Defluviitaleaceae bacterium]|nr:TRAP transporter substrate-binding protein [Defluviitaleaceae bacterium]